MRPERRWAFASLRWRRDSLVTRMTLLALAVGLLSLLLHLAVMFTFVSVVSDELAFALGSTIRHERELLQQAPAGERDALAARLSGPRHRLYRSDLAIAEPTDGWFARPRIALLHKLGREIGTEIKLGVLPAGASIGPDTLVFAFFVDGQRWVIEHAPNAPIMVALGSLASWLMLVALAVIVSLSVGARFIGKPLTALSSALNASPGRLARLAVPADAGYEIRNLVTAFNRLVSEIEEIDAIKQQLLAGVSHDMRTPLTRLRFRVEARCDPQTADALTADLQMLERIVSQFLAYVKGDSSGYGGEPWPLDEVVRKIVSNYTAQGAPVQLSRIDSDAQLPDLEVQRALSNLIDNALTYGRAPVTITLDQQDSTDGLEVRLGVWDEGAGMTEAEFERAKRPFERLPTSEQISGHCGLGLAIVDQVAAHTGATLITAKDADGRFGILLTWLWRA